MFLWNVASGNEAEVFFLVRILQLTSFLCRRILSSQRFAVYLCDSCMLLKNVLFNDKIIDWDHDCLKWKKNLAYFCIFSTFLKSSPAVQHAEHFSKGLQVLLKRAGTWGISPFFLCHQDNDAFLAFLKCWILLFILSVPALKLYNTTFISRSMLLKAKAISCYGNSEECFCGVWMSFILD